MHTNEELFAMGLYDELYLNVEPYIISKFRLYTNIIDDYDEFMGLAGVSFCKAISRYNVDKSKFITYFTCVLHTDILMENRKLKRAIPSHNKVSIYDVCYSSLDGKSLCYVDTIQSNDNDILDFIDDLSIEQCLKKIKVTQLDINIFRLYLTGITQRDICKILNVTQAHVSRSYRKVIKKILHCYN